MKISELYDLSHTRAAAYLSQFTYPWEALDGIKDLILTLGAQLPQDEFDEVEEGVWVAKDAKIFPNAYLGSPCIIDHGTEVRPGAFIRGSALIGRDCVIGNSTELKNCIIFDHTQVPHYNYVGDSILGYHSHMGAGSITSNVKADSSHVVIKYPDGTKIETHRKKVGAMLGDFADIGCNSVLCPGTVIGRKTNVYPLSRVRGVVPAGHIFKDPEHIVLREER